MTGIAISALLALSFAAQGPAESSEKDAEVVSAEATATQAAEKPEKITDRSHPEYIRCKRERVIGSLAKYTKRCYTNREWEKIAQTGNAGARAIVRSGETGMWDEGG